ncbi:MAG: hypothetical protein U5K35_05215 [Rhodohalobacter sp.]|nr:hypothetical protein [Rhodohalobacter sp.]
MGYGHDAPLVLFLRWIIFRDYSFALIQGEFVTATMLPVLLQSDDRFYVK